MRVAAVLRDLARRAASRAARTPLGKDFIHAAVVGSPAGPVFGDVVRWSDRLSGFEDLAFLFASNQLNHGIASLQIDEAAHLYNLARRVGPRPVVELGRFKGGGTLLLASALPDGARLHSYDIEPRFDADLLDVLQRYGLRDRVELVVGDSRTAAPPEDPPALVFVDGDHTYEGARADFERWWALLAPDGVAVLHDAVDTGGYGNVYPGIARLVAELERRDGLERVPAPGSLAQFVRAS